MADALRKLGDGTIAQGVDVLAGNGDVANPVPYFQQDLIGNEHVDLWEGPTRQTQTSRLWGRSWGGSKPLQNNVHWFIICAYE